MKLKNSNTRGSRADKNDVRPTIILYGGTVNSTVYTLAADINDDNMIIIIITQYIILLYYIIPRSWFQHVV